MISRRRVLNGMLLTSAGLLASSVLDLVGPRQALAQATGLVYGAHPDVSPLVLTGRDWTSKYKLNIKYEWFPSAGPADKALVAGDIDLDAPGGGRAVSLQAATKPGDFPLFMGWAYGDYAATLVRPDSPYKEMADLKGKKIGTVVGSGSYMAWLIWLDSQGMSVNDFQIVNMQGGEVAGALASGVIDGATIWEPYPAMMEHRKIGKIIALYAKVVYDAVVIQTRREVIEKKRDALVSFAAAAMDVQDWIKANPVDAAKLVAKGMVDRGAGETPWEAFDAMIRRLIFAPDLAPVMPSLNKIADTSVKLGVIRNRPELSVNTDILADARKLRGKA
jgi:ABC-type nitrate/sulfonate/bicarbonate transport system substrate-binding protein